jgi:hypothetical protein
VLNFLAREIRQHQNIKKILLGENDAKSFLFEEDIILYLRVPKKSIKKLLDLISTFIKIAGYKINIQMSVVFPYTNH